MRKLVMFMVMISMMVMLSAGVANACGCTDDAHVFASMPDETRWEMAEHCGLPTAPPGYFWIMDDLSLGQVTPSMGV